jgi:DNA repair photolyase
MMDGATIEAPVPVPATATATAPGRRLPGMTRVRRRGPLFRPARAGSGDSGLYGLDLTAGCALGCSFCYVRGTARDPGPGRLLFDPEVAALIGPALDAMGRPPRRVVLSPSSDPLPPIREVRDASIRVMETLLGRGIEVVLMTRGRVTRDVVSLLASAPGLVHVAVGVATLGRSLSRLLEPMAPPGRSRLKGIGRLIEAGVPVEVRLEPLMPALTDTRENLRPLFRELGRVGVRDVLAHYAFLQPAIIPSLREALAPLGHSERLVDLYEGGPVFSVGEAGATKHLPLDARREGLARVISLGAEAGLIVRTGPGQNPDLPRLEPSTPPPQAEPSPPRHKERDRARRPEHPEVVGSTSR